MFITFSFCIQILQAEHKGGKFNLIRNKKYFHIFFANSDHFIFSICFALVVKRMDGNV